MMNRLLFNGDYKWCTSLYVYRILLVQETFLFKTTEKGLTAILAFHFLFSLSYLKYFV